MQKKIIFLITIVSIILISVFSFKHTHTHQPLQKKIVAITQIAPHPSLDRIRQGITDELTEKFQNAVTIDFQSAQGNAALATQIAQNFVGKNVDVLVAITTPSAQAMYAANTHHIPMVFAAITDPIAAKLVNNDGSNKPNITGISDAPNIEQQLILLEKYLPKGSVIGIIYNPGETNSNTHTEKLEEQLYNSGFRVIKAPVYSTGDVLQATQSISANIDAFMLPNDNTVISALDAVLQIAISKKIPVFSSDPESVERGCIACVAPDQYQMGRVIGTVVSRILKGEKAEHIKPINAPTQLFENPNSQELYPIKKQVKQMAYPKTRIKN